MSLGEALALRTLTGHADKLLADEEERRRLLGGPSEARCARRAVDNLVEATNVAKGMSRSRPLRSQNEALKRIDREERKP